MNIVVIYFVLSNLWGLNYFFFLLLLHLFTLIELYSIIFNVWTNFIFLRVNIFMGLCWDLCLITKCSFSFIQEPNLRLSYLLLSSIFGCWLSSNRICRYTFVFLCILFWYFYSLWRIDHYVNKKLHPRLDDPFSTTIIEGWLSNIWISKYTFTLVEQKVFRLRIDTWVIFYIMVTHNINISKFKNFMSFFAVLSPYVIDSYWMSILTIFHKLLYDFYLLKLL